MRTFTKTLGRAQAAAPAGFFGCEAAGLAWLAAAGGARCVRVLDCTDVALELEYLDAARPSERAGRELGRALARTHDAGAAGFGSPPEGWDGPGFFGPLAQPLPMSYARDEHWGAFYAEHRLAPMLERASDRLDTGTRRAVSRVMDRCSAGDFDDEDRPARIHGDLWSGNIVWSGADAVLIDPAAHGGHRETDLAMLHLFGCPYLEAVLDGYQSAHPLRAGWRQRIPLHQLYPLLAHVALFGAGYAGPTARAAADALRIS